MSNFATLTSSIPVFIPTFNNPTYLTNFIKQPEQHSVNNIIVVDNNSTYPPMKESLSAIEKKYKVIRLDQNFEPHYILRIKQFYQSLPELFCLSDPDLEFSTSLPVDFINELKIISDDYKIGKVGLALEIPSSKDVLHSEMFWMRRRLILSNMSNNFGQTILERTKPATIYIELPLIQHLLFIIKIISTRKIDTKPSG
jgi:glycosyltransferase involved in cell wall biosynthesis